MRLRMRPFLPISLLLILRVWFGWRPTHSRMSYILRKTSSSMSWTALLGARPRPMATMTSGIFMRITGSTSLSPQSAITSPDFESISIVAPLASSSILRVSPPLPISTAMRSCGMRASGSTNAADPPPCFNLRPRAGAGSEQGHPALSLGSRPRRCCVPVCLSTRPVG